MALLRACAVCVYVQSLARVTHTLRDHVEQRCAPASRLAPSARRRSTRPISRPCGRRWPACSGRHKVCAGGPHGREGAREPRHPNAHGDDQAFFDAPARMSRVCRRSRLSHRGARVTVAPRSRSSRAALSFSRRMWRGAMCLSSGAALLSRLPLRGCSLLVCRVRRTSADVVVASSSRARSSQAGCRSSSLSRGNRRAASSKS